MLFLNAAAPAIRAASIGGWGVKLGRDADVEEVWG